MNKILLIAIIGTMLVGCDALDSMDKELTERKAKQAKIDEAKHEAFMEVQRKKVIANYKRDNGLVIKSDKERFSDQFHNDRMECKRKEDWRKYNTTLSNDVIERLYDKCEDVAMSYYQRRTR